MKPFSVLLASATPREIEPFLSWLRTTGAGKLDLDIMVTGIGLTAASFHLTRQLAVKPYQLIIQAGVAGGFDRRLPLGSVLAVGRETIADQSVVELKELKTLFDLKLVPAAQFPYRNGWLVNPYRNWLKKTGLPVVRAISVNEISTQAQKIRFYREKFNPVTESMEGAALHYCSLMLQVPFLQLRSLSNYVGERNKAKWKMPAAVGRLNEELIKLVTSL